jgi:hypothetical protein
MNTTLDPVRQATLAVPKQPLRCIGTFETTAGAVDYPMSWDETARDTIWAESFLRELGVRAGDFVAVVSTGHEAPWYAPILDAVTRLRATICPLEPARFEVGRALMFFKRFPVSVVIGLDAELAAALESSGGIATVLERVQCVIGRPEATALLSGLKSFRGTILPIGPSLALPCLGGPYVHVNETEWQIDPGSTSEVMALLDRALGRQPWDVPVALRSVSRGCDCPHGRQSLEQVAA